MTVTDPISDMFTRIRNAVAEKHDKVVFGFSNIKVEIAKILKEEGFILDYQIQDEDLKKKNISIDLKYADDGQSLIKHIKRISKSSKRCYVPKSSIPKVLNGFGICIVSTSKGILSGRDARLNNVGGELIGEVY